MDDKGMKTPVKTDFLKNVSDILTQARKNAKTAVNLSMVYAYFEIGKMIVEEEQQGDNRAAYGKYLLQTLSDYLTKQFGKGFSVTNLKQMQISETVLRFFKWEIATGNFLHMEMSKLVRRFLTNLRICQVSAPEESSSSAGPIT